ADLPRRARAAVDRQQPERVIGARCGPRPHVVASVVDSDRQQPAARRRGLGEKEQAVVQGTNRGDLARARTPEGERRVHRARPRVDVHLAHTRGGYRKQGLGRPERGGERVAYATGAAADRGVELRNTNGQAVPGVRLHVADELAEVVVAEQARPQLRAIAAWVTFRYGIRMRRKLADAAVVGQEQPRDPRA